MPAMGGVAAGLLPVLLAAAAGGDPLGRRRQLSSFGSFSADAGNPSMSSTSAGGMPSSMGGMNEMAGMDPMPMLSPQQEEHISHESSALVGSMVEAFLNKQKLEKGEMDCIVEGSGELGGNLGRVTTQFGVIIKQSFGDTIPDIPGLPEPDGMGGLPGLSELGGPDGADSISDMVDQINQGKSPTAKAAPQAPVAKGASTVVQDAPDSPASDPSLAYFYGSRRLQLLPSEPMPEAGVGFGSAASGMPGGMPGGGMMGGGMQAGMQMFPAFAEIGMTVEQIVKESHALVGKCVHSDAQQAFREAGRHMRNLTYMEGHMLANGADIVQELADSVQAYDHHNASVLGHDLGKALRKVLLSSSTNRQLPEGMPGKEAIANVTTGVMKGFFGEGTYMDVNLRRDPGDPVHVDMHDCVGRNVGYFQQIWASTMYLFAQKASQADPRHKSGLETDAGKIQFGTTLAITMMELPDALKKCDINDEQESMIMDSVKALGTGMDVDVVLPGDVPSKKELTNRFAQAMKDWSSMHWETFGRDLGGLLQGAVVKKFPQKYSLEGGLLRQTLLAGQGAGLRGLNLLPALFLLLVALLAVRQRRAIAAWQRREWSAALGQEFDLEDALPARFERSSRPFAPQTSAVE